ncbi:(Fe-S)-cluster assembly protein [Glaciibacter superstes]|uniref:(Fe-S)-cluster assembly protein n=1 Tax=Glaciibacter superstes TaxID=501023 RepID=UPI0003B5795E|nr:(Fe-S)-cluster assembly protein [Glaciibacter superstes]
MLTLTETASTVVASIVSQTETSTTGGLRIDQQDNEFAVAIVDANTPDDVVVEDGTARVFLASTVAEALDDKVLDAQVGDDGSVRFAIGAKA